MEIRNGYYRLTCVPAITAGEVNIRVADPEREIGIQVGGGDLAELIAYLQLAYLQQELNQGKGDD
jgi:hypothetical protein